MSIVILIILKRQNKSQLVLVLQKLLRAGKAGFQIPWSTSCWAFECTVAEFGSLPLCDVLFSVNWGGKHIHECTPSPSGTVLFV